MNNKTQKIFQITAVVSIVIVLLVSCILVGISINNNAIKNDLSQETGAVIGDDENVLESDKVHPMPAKMLFTSAQSASTQSVTLSATVKPVSAANKTVDWKVDWVNPSSSFASGKIATDFLTATPSSDGATTAVVDCKSSFGEKIKITVVSRDNESAKAECIVDFAKKIKGTKLNVVYAKYPQFNFNIENANQALELKPIINPQAWYQVYGESNASNEFGYDYEENYTVNNSVTANKIEIKISDELKSALSTQGLTSGCENWKVMEKFAYANLIFEIGGPSLNGAGVLQVTNYNKLLTCFGKTLSSDFQLKITTTAQYGGSVTTIYNCHYDHSSAGLAVESVEVNGNLTI